MSNDSVKVIARRQLPAMDVSHEVNGGWWLIFLLSIRLPLLQAALWLQFQKINASLNTPLTLNDIFNPLNQSEEYNPEHTL